MTSAGGVTWRYRRALFDLVAQSKGRLFRKYAALLVALVGSALIVSAATEGFYSYFDHRDAFIAVQREKAIGAATVIEQFVREIEGQVGWTTHASFATGQSGVDQRRFDFLRLLRQAPAITEVAYLDANGREQLKVSRLAMDVSGSGLDRSGEKNLNPFDTHAIEAAMQIREGGGVDVDEIVAVTMGPESAFRALQVHRALDHGSLVQPVTTSLFRCKLAGS